MATRECFGRVRGTHAIGVLALSVLAVHCSSSTTSGGNTGSTNPDGGREGSTTCMAAPDQDGVTAGSFAFTVNVSDTAFSPVILKAQNNAMVTLTVTNTGMKPHDFAVTCMSGNGCSFCFPDAAKISQIAPGRTATTMFMTPDQEGIYNFTSDLTGDTETGQFVIQ